MAPCTLSAALIVRDEAAMLADCLASLDGLADEIVVGDTGSRDDSIEIARSLGARVLDVPWQDDFSAARNAVLDRCRGDWILYIDADERVRAMERDRLAPYLADTGAVGYRLPLQPAAGYTAYWEYRLFRNDPRLRFERVIHEKIRFAMERVATSDDQVIGACPMRLDHVGYDGDQTAKHRRNLPLLLAQRRETPDDIYNETHIGRILAETGDDDGAGAVWRRAIEVARANPEDNPLGVLPFLALLRAQADSGDFDDDLLAEARQLYACHHDLDWIAGVRLIQRERYDSAIDIFERLASIDGETLIDDHFAYDARMFEDFAYQALGMCYFRLGEPDRAAQWFRRVGPTSAGRCQTNANWSAKPRSR